MPSRLRPHPHWKITTITPYAARDRQQVEHRRLQRHQDRAEHDHQQQERQQHDRADEPRQRVRDALGEVDERRRAAADVDHRALRRGGRDRLVAEAPHQVGRRLILRRGGGDHLDDRGVARLVRLRRRDGRHARGRLDRRRQLIELLQRGRIVHLDRQQQRAVEPRSEPLGEEVVGQAARLGLRRGPVIGEPELHREQRDREDEQDRDRAHEVPPGMPLHLVAPPGPHGRLGGLQLLRGLALAVHAQLVDRVPREAEERGQQRDGRDDGHQDHDRRGGRHHADERDPRDPQAQERDRDHDAGEHDGLPRGGGRQADRVQRVHALVQVLPVARDDEQGVVDPDAQPDHRRQDRGELRHGRERRQDQGEAGPRGEADHGRRDRQSHRDHGAERDQQDDHRGQQADQLGRARLGLRPPRGVLAADLRLQVGGADVVEGRLERLERLDAQVGGRLVVGDLRVADRAVGRQGARGLERVRDGDHVRLARDRVQGGVHGVGLVLERPVGRVEDDVRRGAGGGGVALGQQVVGALRLGVRQVEVVAELAAEGAADHEDRDHGGDPDAEGAPTVARCRLAEPIEERTHVMAPYLVVLGDALSPTQSIQSDEQGSKDSGRRLGPQVVRLAARSPPGSGAKLARPRCLPNRHTSGALSPSIR